MSDVREESSQPDNYHRLLYQNQSRIYAYVLTMVGNYSDADDVMQETISFMWKRFEDFELGSDFVAWGIRIARYKILEHRRRQKKHDIVQYSDGSFEKLSSLAVNKNDNLSNQNVKLKECLKKLKHFKKRYFTVIALKFFENCNTNDIAKRIGVSVPNVYTIMSRAYGYLLACMKKSMSSAVSKI
ncbi:RNA polymerase sigma factor [Anaerohalosphaera lusitana]|uniref:RNA polymerase sigma factor n=1 Tax=Anaerohalosphaera lusitana TaxID=1936003 RepID=A0A1U9NJI9_9BACT|nr:sigma-70 family RNA polymerase sigma factor [Anaerohalosphaera lusitana]AQT68092.1 RNA polymerase sigma factor [Anaerohalosphaera lusitana]